MCTNFQDGHAKGHQAGATVAYGDFVSASQHSETEKNFVAATRKAYQQVLMQLETECQDKEDMKHKIVYAVHKTYCTTNSTRIPGFELIGKACVIRLCA